MFSAESFWDLVEESKGESGCSVACVDFEAVRRTFVLR